MPEPVFSLEAIIKQLTQAHDTKKAEVLARTQRIQTAVTRYEIAATQEVLREFNIRNGLPVPKTVTSPVDAALDLLALVNSLPELGELSDKGEKPAGEEPEVMTRPKGPRLTPVPEGEPEDTRNPSEPNPYARLALHTATKPLCIIGGYVFGETRDWMKKDYDINYEWIETHSGAAEARMVAAGRRMKGGSYCGVIILEHLMGREHVAMLKKAAEDAKIFVALGGKGHKGKLKQLFGEFEEQLKHPRR
jgi:hypothetical protein